MSKQKAPSEIDPSQRLEELELDDGILAEAQRLCRDKYWHADGAPKAALGLKIICARLRRERGELLARATATEEEI